MARFAPHATVKTGPTCQSVFVTDDSNYNTPAEPNANVDNDRVDSFTLRQLYVKDIFGNIQGTKDLAPDEFTAEFPINVTAGVFLIVGVNCQALNNTYVVERGVYLSCIIPGGLGS